MISKVLKILNVQFYFTIMTILEGILTSEEAGSLFHNKKTS